MGTQSDFEGLTRHADAIRIQKQRPCRDRAKYCGYRNCQRGLSESFKLPFIRNFNVN